MSAHTAVVLTPAGSSAREIRRWLGASPSRLVIVTRRPPPPELRAVPNAEVRLAESDAAAHAVLARVTPIDLIVDAWGGNPAAQRRRWEHLFFHLRDGGEYRVVGPRMRGRAGAWVDSVELVAPVPPEPEGGDESPDADRELRRAVRARERARGRASLFKRGDHLLKLRDEDASELIAAREPEIAVEPLTIRPGGSFVARDTVTHHEAEVPVVWPGREIVYPPLHLRRYTGNVGYTDHMLSHGRHSILPEAYRWHLSADPSNPATVNSSPAFARLSAPSVVTDASAPILDGDYYQIEPQHPGFGHVMTELIGRLWGWHEAKAAFPGLKTIGYVYKRPDRIAKSPKFQVLRAFGIDPDEMVWTDRPVRLRSLVSATSMWHNNVPYTVHPDLPRVWERLRETLPAPDGPTFDKIFVSRGVKYRRRECRNASMVESIFVDHGYELIYPEAWSLPDQARIFGHARVVAGFGGSGLFNVLFAQRLEAMVIVNQDSYFHRNEHLFTSLLGPDVHYFWSPADIAQTEAGNDIEASESAWEFDLFRHSTALRALLRRL